MSVFESKLDECRAIMRWMLDAIYGEPLSDFALSFDEVRRCADQHIVLFSDGFETGHDDATQRALKIIREWRDRYFEAKAKGNVNPLACDPFDVFLPHMINEIEHGREESDGDR